MDFNNLSYEEAFKTLEGLVNKLESNKLSLDDSLNIYSDCTLLIKRCNDLLNSAEQKVAIIRKDAQGEPVEMPFAED